MFEYGDAWGSLRCSSEIHSLSCLCETVYVFVDWTQYLALDEDLGIPAFDITTSPGGKPKNIFLVNVS